MSVCAMLTNSSFGDMFYPHGPSILYGVDINLNKETCHSPRLRKTFRESILTFLSSTKGPRSPLTTSSRNHIRDWKTNTVIMALAPRFTGQKLIPLGGHQQQHTLELCLLALPHREKKRSRATLTGFRCTGKISTTFALSVTNYYLEVANTEHCIYLVLREAIQDLLHCGPAHNYRKISVTPPGYLPPAHSTMASGINTHARS